MSNIKTMININATNHTTWVIERLKVLSTTLQDMKKDGDVINGLAIDSNKRSIAIRCKDKNGNTRYVDIKC